MYVKGENEVAQLRSRLKQISKENFTVLALSMAAMASSPSQGLVVGIKDGAWTNLELSAQVNITHTSAHETKITGLILPANGDPIELSAMVVKKGNMAYVHRKSCVLVIESLPEEKIRITPELPCRSADQSFAGIYSFSKQTVITGAR